MMNPVIATNILQAIQRRIGKNWGLITKAEGGDKSLRLEDIKSSSGAGWTKTSPRKPELKKEHSNAGDGLAKSGSKASIPSSSSKSAMQPVAENKEGSKDRKAAEKKKDAAEKKEAADKKTEKKEEDAKVAKSKSRKTDDNAVKK